MQQNDILFSLFITIGSVCALVSVLISVVCATKGKIIAEASPLNELRKNVSKFAGIGLLGALAVQSGNQGVQIAVSIAILVLVADEPFALAAGAIITRFKNGHKIMDAYSKQRKERIAAQAADLASQEEKPKDDDNDRHPPQAPQGPMPPIISGPPIATPATASPATVTSSAPFEATALQLMEQAFGDIRTRLFNAGKDDLIFREFFVPDLKARTAYDAVILDSANQTRAIVEVKFRNTIRPDEIKRLPSYNYALQQNFALWIVYITTHQKTPNFIKSVDRVRAIDGVEGVLIYSRQGSAVAPLDVEDISKLA